MKTIVLLLSFFVLSLVAFAAKTPPTAVLNAFNQKFQKAEKVKWAMEEAKEWEAEFTLNGKETSASFDPSGKWLETETKINKAVLPTEIKAAINKQFPEAKIGECSNITTSEFTGYEIELNNKGKKLEIQITNNGKMKINDESKEKD